MFYLAAAVSDFYIPASEMPEHKIQSSNGPLQVQNRIKMFIFLSHVTIFKLLTRDCGLSDKHENGTQNP